MDINKINPLAGYILIKPKDSETKTSSGIILPGSANVEKPSEGEVLAVGAPFYEDGQEKISPVKVGEKVLYKKWAGNEIKIEGVEYSLLKFEDLMAKINK